MRNAIDRAYLTTAQRDVLAAALRDYHVEQKHRSTHDPISADRADGVWRAYVAAELLAMFV